MVEVKINREEFIKQNLGLVHSICRRFAGRGLEYDDLYQAGCMGLVKAVDAFDSERGFAFSTYAVPVIMGEVRRLFRDGGTVRVSRSIKELSLKIARRREECSKSGHEPTIAELAAYFEVTEEQITEAVSATLGFCECIAYFNFGEKQRQSTACPQISEFPVLSRYR